MDDEEQAHVSDAIAPPPPPGMTTLEPTQTHEDPTLLTTGTPPPPSSFSQDLTGYFATMGHDAGNDSETEGGFSQPSAATVDAAAPRGDNAAKLARNPNEAHSGLQMKSDINALRTDALVAQPALVGKAQELADLAGGTLKAPKTIKGLERSNEKVANDYKGDASQLTDIARASVQVGSMQQIRDAASIMQNGGDWDVLREKDKFKNPINGYRDMNFNVAIDAGGSDHVAELQLQHKAIQDVKSGAGHKIYEQSRSLQALADNNNADWGDIADLNAANDKMQGMYDDAIQPELEADHRDRVAAQLGANAPVPTSIDGEEDAKKANAPLSASSLAGASKILTAQAQRAGGSLNDASRALVNQSS